MHFEKGRLENKDLRPIRSINFYDAAKLHFLGHDPLNGDLHVEMERSECSLKILHVLIMYICTLNHVCFQADSNS